MKAAYMKVVPEAYRKGMEMQLDIDRSPQHVIQDMIMQFILSNSSGGPTPMDTNFVGNSAQ